MQGGGTCRDVCLELGIVYEGRDLVDGFDAADTNAFEELGPFDFVWLHPPYWNMIRYSRDPRCLANAPTVAEFVKRLRLVLRNCARVLTGSGKLAVLMGDERQLYIPPDDDWISRSDVSCLPRNDD
jgi:hypothetical protein